MTEDTSKRHRSADAAAASAEAVVAASKNGFGAGLSEADEIQTHSTLTQAIIALATKGEDELGTTAHNGMTSTIVDAIVDA